MDMKEIYWILSDKQIDFSCIMRKQCIINTPMLLEKIEQLCNVLRD